MVSPVAAERGAANQTWQSLRESVVPAATETKSVADSKSAISRVDSWVDDHLLVPPPPAEPDKSDGDFGDVADGVADGGVPADPLTRKVAALEVENCEMTGRVAGLEAMLREKEQESHELRRQLLAITRALEEGSHADTLSRAELLNQVLSLANQVKELSDERAALLSAPGGVAFNYGLGGGSKKSVASEKAPEEHPVGEFAGVEEGSSADIEDKPDEPAAADAARVSSYRPPPAEALVPASAAEEEDHGTEPLSSAPSVAPSMTPSRPGTSLSSRSQQLIPRSYTMPVLAPSGPSSQSRLSALPMSIVPYDPATAAESMANVTAPIAGAIVPYQPPGGSLVAGEVEGSESAVVTYMPPTGPSVRSNPFDRPNTYEMNRPQASGPSAKPSRVQSFVPSTVPETAAEGATSGLGAMRGAIATLIRCGTRPEVREIQIRHLEKLNRSKRVTPEDIFAAIQSRCLTILAQVEPPSGFNILGVKVKIPRKLTSISSSISLTSTSSASTTPSNIRVTDSEAKFLTSPSVELVAFLFAAVVTHAWAPIECFPAIMEQMGNMYVRRLLIVDFLDAAFKRVGRLGVDALVQDLRGIDRLLGVNEERLPSVKELSNCKSAKSGFNPSVCQICGDDVGRTVEGDLFIACNECAYPVCRPCYEYERKEGSRACPQCKSSYKRLKGSPRIDTDDDEDDTDDVEQEFGISENSSGRDDGTRRGMSQQHGDPQHQGQQQMHPDGSNAYDSYHVGSHYPMLTSGQVDPDMSMSSDYNNAGAMVPASALPNQAYNYSQSNAGDMSMDVRALDPSKDLGDYGYGSVVWKDRLEAWKQQQGRGGPMGGMGMNGAPPAPPVPGPDPMDTADLPNMDESRQPLSRKVHYPSSLISPYRLIIIIRLFVLAFFLRWRCLNPVDGAWVAVAHRETYLDRLALRYERRGEPSQLAAVDLFVSTVDPAKEPPITTANTLLSILSVDYPTEKVSCYVHDDGGAMLTFDSMSECSEFARRWVPFAKRYKIEPRCPEMYFTQKVDYLKDKVDPQFVKDRRAIKVRTERRARDEERGWVGRSGYGRRGKIVWDETGSKSMGEIVVQLTLCLAASAHTRLSLQAYACLISSAPVSFPVCVQREYEEFKIRINMLVAKSQKVPDEGWTMQDGTPWPGNKSRDHPGMIQVFLGPSGGTDVEGNMLPRLVYVSREKRPGYNHHKKAGAMNSLIRVSAVLTNAPYMLNLDCDHYIADSKALREAMCFMMDPNVGKKCCYVQFPQRFDGIDPNDRYANNNTVFFDINLPGLDGIQGPCYVGTGCCFRRRALYGYDPPKPKNKRNKCGVLCSCFSCCGGGGRGEKGGRKGRKGDEDEGTLPLYDGEEVGEGDSLVALKKFEKKFGQSPVFVLSTFHEDGGGVASASPGSTLKEAIHVISCGYEEKTEWGKERIVSLLINRPSLPLLVTCSPSLQLGWIYGSVTEDILTGFKMHSRGWRSIYCKPKRPTFKGGAPINLSDRLQQVLRWALGSVEIFLSRHCPIWYGWKGNNLKVLQRLSYTNTVVYPFTSFPLLVYCTIPAICLFTNKFIVPALDTTSTLYFIALFMTIFATGLLEMRWSGVGMTDWWRNEQFWVIGGVSAHLFAVFQGLLKVLAGIDTNFTVTAKQAEDGEFAELYLFKWTSLLIPPLFLLIINFLGIVCGVATAMNTGDGNWGPLFGRLFFSFWVIMHLYPFMKGLGGRNQAIPTIVIVWSVLLASIFSLLWVKIDPFSSTEPNPSDNLQQCGVSC
ncbi:unnamed protein product [Closterium sp. NIES-64]|nr:unnamed protein product [Closterium sp. NIES-64]